MIMDHGPLVSIIIPTKNSSKTLEVCLRSIVAQTYKNIELIVVDNHSSDTTPYIAKKYTDKVYNFGPERNAQKVLGVKKAHGSYFSFIDSDMELSPLVVEDAIGKCERGGYGAMILPEISKGDGFWAQCRKLEKACYLGDNFMELANRFMRKEVYCKVGGYEKNYHWIGGEDFDINARIIAGGFKIGRINSFIYHHEITNFKRILVKYYYYGKYVFEYSKHYPQRAFSQFIFLRPAFMRNIPLLLKSPLYSGGLFFMKLSQYIAGMIGMGEYVLWKR